MAIARAKISPRARALARSSLVKRAHWAKAIPVVRDNAEVGPPLPLYRIGPGAVARKDGLRRAPRAGWRLPVVQKKGSGLINLLSFGGRLKYAGITLGDLPARVLAAEAEAEKALGKSRSVFEPRLLEIPALRLHVFWLQARTGRDLFIPLSHEHLEIKEMLGKTSFRAFVRHAAAELKRH